MTPSSAFRSMTPRQSAAPVSAIGIRNPSGKLRCTTYRGIRVLLVRRTDKNAMNLRATEAGRIGTTPHVGVRGYLSWGGKPESSRLRDRFAATADV